MTIVYFLAGNIYAEEKTNVHKKPSTKKSWTLLTPEQILYKPRVTPPPKPPRCSPRPPRVTYAPQERLHQRYCFQIGGYLYEKWATISSGQFEKTDSEANITIELSPKGQVTSWKFTEKSDTNEFTAAIEKLMRSVTKLPVPPKGLDTIEVQIEAP